jgi:fructokinase
MFDVTALGELLIDFTPAGDSRQENLCFERNPGGAPANVLTAISKLGGKTAFIGKVGDDIFGHYLSQVLKDNNICTEGLKFSKLAKTTLAFVQLNADGDRSFSFYRNPGADTTLEASEVNYPLIEQSRVFHFGSLTLTDEPSRSATISAVKHAKKSGCIISYDPNLRPALWADIGQAKTQILSLLQYADILKISEEELVFITGTNDLIKGSNELSDKYDIKLILITRGADGCFFRYGDEASNVPTFNQIKAVIQQVQETHSLEGFYIQFYMTVLKALKIWTRMNL